MTKEDILGGLRNAMSKGASLKDAMQSFYNAGYKKEEIEQVAREFQSQQKIQQNQNQQMQIQKSQSKQQTNQYKQSLQSQDYIKPQSSNKGWIIFFIILLLILIGAAISLFIFKSEIIELINNSF